MRPLSQPSPAAHADGRRRRRADLVASLCLVLWIALATGVLYAFGLSIWTALFVLIVLACPLTAGYVLVLAHLRPRLPLGPPPQTRGITMDWLAPVYNPFCRLMGVGMGVRRRTLGLAALRAGDRVLDVGCGTGVLTRLAAEAVGPTGMTVGIDPGPRMIEIARRDAARTHSRAAFELGVVERLAFPDESFDVVLSSFMLHHLPADVKRAGLGEMHRVLKPGGRLVLVDIDPARPVARAMIALFKHVPDYRPALSAAGDPVPPLREAGFTDVAAAGGWLGAASFWVARRSGGREPGRPGSRQETRR